MIIDEKEVAQAFDDYVDTLGAFLEHSGFSDEDIDEYFLEHVGVKGMKWGVRKAGQGARAAGRGTVRGAKATGRFINDHKKGVAIGVGGAVVGAFLLKNHNTNMRQAAALASRRRDDTNFGSVHHILKYGSDRTRNEFLSIMGGNNPRRLQEHVGLKNHDFDNWLMNYSIATMQSSLRNGGARGPDSRRVERSINEGFRVSSTGEASRRTSRLSDTTFRG